MITKLKNIDRELFLFINGRHNGFFDPIMYWASHKWFWLPFYALIAYLIVHEYRKNSLRIFIALGFLIAACDQTASNLIKNTFKRLRPSHESSLQNLVHLSEAGPGGKYGFVSSHAANAFGLAIFLIAMLPPKYRGLKIILVCWAVLVSYSRVYNGVHYPSDVIVAGIIGSIFGLLAAKLCKKYLYKTKRKEYEQTRMA